MTDYGLTGLRDKDGEIQPVDYTYEWNGQEITIKLRPPTIAEQEEIEQLDDDAPAGELEDLLSRHILKPEIKDSWTTREMWAYIEGLMRWSMGDDAGDLADELADELEKRDQSSGN